MSTLSLIGTVDHRRERLVPFVRALFGESNAQYWAACATHSASRPSDPGLGLERFRRTGQQAYNCRCRLQTRALFCRRGCRCCQVCGTYRRRQYEDLRYGHGVHVEQGNIQQGGRGNIQQGGNKRKETAKGYKRKGPP